MVKNKSDIKVGDDDINLDGFFKEIRERRIWFIVAMIVAIASAFIYIKFTLPVYEASSTVLIEETAKPTVNMEDFLAGDLFGDQANIATEKGVLGSRSVMRDAIKQLNLQVSYFNASSYPNQPLYKKQPFELVIDSTSKIPTWLYDVPIQVSFSGNTRVNKRFKISFEAEDENGNEITYSGEHKFGEQITNKNFQFVVNQKPQTVLIEQDYEILIHNTTRQVNEYLSRLRIESPDKDATIVKLTFLDHHPERAMDIINTVCKVYINLDIADKTSVASLTLHFVNEQLDQTSQVVSEIESELQGFKEKNKTVNLSEESKAVLDKLNAIDIEKMKSDIELRSLDNLLNYVTSNSDMTEMAPSTMGLPDPLLVELISRFQELQSRRKSLAYGVKNVTPAIKVIDQQIADTRASLIENIKSIQKNVRSTNSALAGQLGEYETKISKVPEIERDLLAIQRKFEVNQNIYIYLLQKKAETSIAKAAAISDNKVLDEASLAEEPVEPNKKVVVLFALFAAVIVPLILIFVIKFLKTTVSSREEIARITAIPILGVVGHGTKNDNLFVQHHPKSRIAESFRSVRTNLQFFGSRSGNKVILITSSVGGEGKSFVTINLASVFALQNFRVIIVGLDLRKPKLFQDFNLSNEHGVSSYLIGRSDIDSLIKPTGIPNLDIMPAGPIPPNPSELISKPEMASLFSELEKRYDYIFIDTPPVGIVSDALQLMQYSHINVYVVRENYSRKDYITSLNDQFEEGKFKNLSILLNDSTLGKGYGYAYGAGYGYGNGSGYYDDDFATGTSKKVTAGS